MTAALVDRTIARGPAARQGRRPAGPRLRVLDQVAVRRRTRYRNALLLLLLSVLTGFFAVAFVHAELVAGQHDLDAMRAEIAEAEAHHAELARSVEEASAPAVIVTRAQELGMVPSSVPVYLAAAAPLRPVEVRAALPATIASEGPGSDSAPTIDTGTGVDGAPSVTTSRDEIPGADRALRGSLGSTGGISAAIRLPTAPASTDDPVAATAPSGATAAPTGVTVASPGVTAPDVTVGASAETSKSLSTAGPEPSTVGTVVGASISTQATGGVAGTDVTGGVSGPGNAVVSASPIAGTRAVSSTTAGAVASSTSGMATAAAATGAG